MNKTFIKRFSILGLVLLAASAVTAALVSNTKTDNKNPGPQSSLTCSSDGRLTCTTTLKVDSGYCFNTDSDGNSTGGTTLGAYISVEASTLGDNAD